MEKATISQDSFQCELEDYIRKQRARGLQPRIGSSKAAEASACQDRGHLGPQPFVRGQNLSFRKPSTSLGLYNRLSALGSHLPPWSKGHAARQRTEDTSRSEKKQKHFREHPRFLSPLLRGKNLADYRAQPRQDSPCFFPKDHAGLPEPGSKESHLRRHGEEGQEHMEEEPVLKRKYHGDGHSHKENKRKDKVSKERHTHRRKHQAGDATSTERRRHGKKMGAGRESAQERDLWDEAILGGYS